MIRGGEHLKGRGKSFGVSVLGETPMGEGQGPKSGLKVEDNLPRQKTITQVTESGKGKGGSGGPLQSYKKGGDLLQIQISQKKGEELEKIPMGAGKSGGGGGGGGVGFGGAGGGCWERKTKRETPELGVGAGKSHNQQSF